MAVAALVLGGAAQAGAYNSITQTFSYTGGEQTFTVPAGVTQVHVIAVGGKGAPGGSPATLGGAARVSTDLAVTPGATLYVEVGGNASGLLSAFNGGGLSGGTGAGGGGGASDIQTCSIVDACDAHTSGIVVAGGSGGGGGNGGGAGAGLGGAGGNAKSNGSAAGPLLGTNPAGGGVHGTVGMGGPGGAATTFGGGCTGNVSPFGAGSNAAGPSGGHGGTAYSNAGSGGGGGGGYLGGGGGGGGGVVTCPSASPAAAGGGGGGAGASFIFGADPAQLNTATTVAGTDTPQIAITYTPADTTAPTIAIDTPADGAVYEPNATVNASYSCTDDAGGSGVASCAGPVPDGSPIDTSTLGQHSFTVDAQDNAGNPATSTVNYRVAVNADVSVAIHGPANVVRGRKASFKIKVPNHGPDTAKHVVVVDHLPDGLQALGVGSAVPEGSLSGTCGLPATPGGSVKCTLSSLHAGEALAMTVRTRAKKLGKQTQRVAVHARTYDPNTANNSAELTTKVTKP